MSKRTYKRTIAAAAAAGLLIAAPAFAEPVTLPGPGMGSGMMGGHGHGNTMGHGMMGGAAYGPSMVPGMNGGGEQECDLGRHIAGGHAHGTGMSPGMMGDYGQGYGMGSGMMGSWRASGLNLSDEQQTKARKIHDAARKKIWPTLGGLLDASSELRELLSAPNRDRTAISAAHKQVTELRRQMFEIRLDAEDEFERILSTDQLKLLKR